MIPLFLGIILTSCYDDEISNLKNQINALKNTNIASLREQISAINKTLPELENADKELQSYISALQNTASDLQNSINETNAKIEGIYLDGGVASTDIATLQEIRKALEDFKTSGKFILA